ncbi:MAG: UDPGP type 1 family protein [Candidatus Nealsonbacteria bacterium]|nr:UDPGP type 1 family protein [Candidatus Nealsonbacteria bacterium]
MNSADDRHDLLHYCLTPWKQEHVLRWWQELAVRQRKQLGRQVQQLDLQLLQRLFARASSDDVSRLPSPDAIHPAIAVAGKDGPGINAIQLGQQALRAGQVAVVLVAGGNGTRLGHEGPKGTFPIGPVSNRSLFQIHAEKILAIGRRYRAPLPLYIMTSPENDEATREFFAEHAMFGLDADQVIFFQQGTMPVLDRRTGKLLMTQKHRIAASPNGHGGVLEALAGGGHLADMQRRGIEHVFYYQVDNPLVKVADPAYLGHHIRAASELSLKVVRKTYPEEKLGVVVEVNGRLRLIEYSDLPEEVAGRRSADGKLEIWAGNIAVHLFTLSFLQRLTADGVKLPCHRAIKKVPYLDDRGKTVEPTEPNAVKFEMFVFDALPLARKALLVETDRREEFEPLKNAEGDSSPASVRQAMSNLYATWLEGIDVPVPRHSDRSVSVPLEISPLLALDAEQLRDRLAWRGPVNGPLLLDERAAATQEIPQQKAGLGPGLWRCDESAATVHRARGGKPRDVRGGKPRGSQHVS